MPIVRVAKARPAYVDAPVPNADHRREHAIVATHGPAFTRAFMRLSRSILTPTITKDLLAAMEDMERGKKTLEEVVAVVPWFDPLDPDSVATWNLFGESLKRAITATVEDAGESEFRAQGWPLKFEVTKAEEFRVPVNPFSIRWIEDRAAKLIVGVSDEQRALVRQIIAEGFAAGERPQNILAEIALVVGLTPRESAAVERRFETMIEADVPEEKARVATERYSNQLLKKRAQRISRTETIEAYSQGLDDSWQLADEAGFVPAATMQEWVEIANSARTCIICRDLGGQRVPLGQPFMSAILGEVDRPPSHPHCRCSKVLVFPDEIEGSPEESKARADADTAQARVTLAGG